MVEENLSSEEIPKKIDVETFLKSSKAVIF
jgi:hypothetical protein